MTGVITYITTFGRLPDLDRQGRPKCSTRNASTTNATAARTSTPASSSKPGTTRARARAIVCISSAANGPTTYNACTTTRWNNGVSFPIQSGHGCLGCSEDAFWDQGSFYQRLDNITMFGVEKTADQIGFGVAAATAAAIGLHAGLTAIKRAADRNDNA